MRQSLSNIRFLRNSFDETGSFHANRPFKLNCIAMHVRHGDSRFDHRKFDLTTDRSFEAHAEELKNLSKVVGTNVVFLMTDNSSLPYLATKLFPEYRWMMQRRPIREGNNFIIRNERDIQLELAHLLVDIRFAGQCAGLIASLDSGVAEQVIQSMGSQRREGVAHLPYIIDIRGNILRRTKNVET